jgi:ubiquinone/menaquinone biosynthesis C-methylase UbiE
MTGNVWAAGDFGKIAPAAQGVGEWLCDEAPLYAGQRVLDVGCGTGNTALAAARRRTEVTGVDPVEFLLNQARQRAEFEGLTVDWRLGGAEALPCESASFDVVLSSFGLIFSGDAAGAVEEAARVLRPGGGFAFTAWCEGCLNDELFRICAAARPELQTIAGARDWGREGFVLEKLGRAFTGIRFVPRFFTARAVSVEAWLAGMKQFLAPVVLAYEGLSAAAAAELDECLLALGAAKNEAPEHGFFARVPYYEVHARKL